MDGAIESGVRCALNVLGQPFDHTARPAASPLLPGPNVSFDFVERNAPSIGSMIRGVSLAALFIVTAIALQRRL
jgi:hypothetical protein